MSERHRAAGRLGGQAVVARYGREWMRAIGKRGGRPRWEVALAKAWERHAEARGRARLRRKEVLAAHPAVPSPPSIDSDFFPVMETTDLKYLGSAEGLDPTGGYIARKERAKL